MTAGGPILVIDTATTHAVIALGGPDGELLEARSWIAGYRHGEELLARIEGLLADRGLAAADLGGLVCGTGPGAFTGLRVGLATAKALAHALRLPIAGVATSSALLAAAGASTGGAAAVLLQPAGPSDRVVTRAGVDPFILPGGTELDLVPGEVVVAVDLAGRAPEDATIRGDAACTGLATALLEAGLARLAAGGDDLARLVPEYVTLPRGVLGALPDDAVEISGGTTR
ncbi:MAG: tRNA (adenosine(37)-N6)-threonylcarbamoyltransferase complex dimerization subunit type 1 TsaB [Chloroflexota bacterium]